MERLGCLPHGQTTPNHNKQSTEKEEKRLKLLEKSGEKLGWERNSGHISPGVKEKEVWQIYARFATRQASNKIFCRSQPFSLAPAGDRVGYKKLAANYFPTNDNYSCGVIRRSLKSSRSEKMWE